MILRKNYAQMSEKVLRKSHLYVLLLVSLISHSYLFFDSKNLNAGDWGFNSISLIKEFLTHGLWATQTGFGSVMPLASNMVFYWIASLLARTSTLFTWDIFTRLFFLAPITFLTPYFSFKFFSKVLDNKDAAFAAACIYCFNTFFLKLQLDWLTYGSIWWVFPALLLLADNYLETRLRKYLAFMTLLVFLGMVYEPRIMILVLVVLTGFIFIKLITSDKSKSYITATLLAMGSLLAGLGIHSYWLLPTKMGLASDILANASTTPFTAFFSLIDTLTLHSYQWTNNYVLEPFFRQPVNLRYYLIPIIMTIGIVSYKRVRQTQGATYFLFFATLLIIGVFLSKQSFAPLGSIYAWAFYHIPLFNIYRESSKFLIFAALAIAFFFAAGLQKVTSYLNYKQVPYPKLIGVIILVSVSIYNLQHFADQKIGGMTKGVAIDQDYKRIDDVLSQDSNYYRVLWAPFKPRFGPYSEIHPALDLGGLVSSFENLTGFKLYDKTSTVDQQLIYLLKQPYAQQLLSNATVKYVILPADAYHPRTIINNDPVNVPDGYSYSNSRKEFENYLNNLPYLHKVNLDTKNVLVYEVTSMQPYIGPVTSIYRLGSTNDIYGKSNILEATQKNPFHYTLDNGKTHVSQLMDVIDNLSPSELVSSGIKRTLDLSDSKSLLLTKSASKLAYSVQKGQLTVSRQSTGTPTHDDKNNLIAFKNSAATTLGSTALNPEKKYFLETKDSLIPLNNPSYRDGLLRDSTDFSLASSTLQNPVPLKEGFWEQDEASCGGSNTGTGSVKFESVEGSITGDGVKVTTHEGSICMKSPPQPIQPGEHYVLNFRYQVQNSDLASATISFNDNRKSTIEMDLPTYRGGWIQPTLRVDAPNGATEMTIVLRSNANYISTSISSFSDMSYGLLSPVKNFSSVVPTINSTNLANSSKSVDISFNENDQQSKNLVSNPTFSKGLWEQQIGDCNNYDNQAKLRMELTQGPSSDIKAIQLEAAKHIACTSPQTMQIEPGGDYLLSFDHQSSTTSEFGYSVNFDDPQNTVVSKRLPSKDTTWSNYKEIIKVPLGAHSATLTIFTYSDETGTVYSVNRYSNFFFAQIPDIGGEYYLVSSPQQKLVDPSKVDFTLVNPTKKLVHIKGATTPFYLNMSEAYHDKWQLEMNNAKLKGLGSWLPWAVPDAVAANDHYKLDDFANGWYIDVNKLCKQQNLCTKNADGSYDMEMAIEFTPQRWFYVGLIISGTTLIACLGYLGYALVKRRGGES